MGLAAERAFCVINMERAPLKGFSLVEVALSLGVITFCMVALIGLMPVASGTLREADLRSGASDILRRIAAGIRNAAPNAQGRFQMIGLGNLGKITWGADGQSIAPTNGTLTRHGSPAPSSASSYAYRLEITPPDSADPASLGHAVIRIAWPETADWGGGKWLNAQGNEESLILFRLP